MFSSWKMRLNSFSFFNKAPRPLGGGDLEENQVWFQMNDFSLIICYVEVKCHLPILLCVQHLIHIKSFLIHICATG